MRWSRVRSPLSLPRSGPASAHQRLDGVSQEMELFTFAKDKLTIPVDFDRIELKVAAKN